MDNFDVFVIGGGPGGYVAALEAARLGKTVALAEAKEVGGTCLNRGCIPTKALLRAARVYREAGESEDLGITVTGKTYDMVAMHRRVDAVTTQLRSGIEALLARAKVTVIPARATIAEPGVVEAAGTRYSATNIILATGSQPAQPPIPGISLPGVVTSDQLLETAVDCSHIVIIGGGVVGVEFAQIYNDLGRTVTILEAMPRLLPPLDKELGQNLSMIFKKRGIDIHTGAMVQEIAAGVEGLTCRYTEKDETKEVSADCVLVCTGRRPNTKNIVSPNMDLGMERGYIPVNGKDGKTKIDGIYAIGDVVLGGVQLAHAAEAAARNAVAAICGLDAAKRVSVIPSCVFTQPEIAVAGMTADEAKAAGYEVALQKNLTSANGKAVIEGADRGFVKLVADSTTGVLLGVQLMCPHASEMIGGLAAAIGTGMTLNQLAQTVFPHPTISEAILG